nr:linusorb C1 precursor protein G11-514P [Linum usitatissimum]FAA04141.1 TPA: Linusorb C1 precursor protein G11-514P [Linum usitatissimum]
MAASSVPLTTSLVATAAAGRNNNSKTPANLFLTPKTSTVKAAVSCKLSGSHHHHHQEEGSGGGDDMLKPFFFWIFG